MAGALDSRACASPPKAAITTEILRRDAVRGADRARILRQVTDAHHPLQRDIASEQRSRGAAAHPPPSAFLTAETRSRGVYDGGGGGYAVPDAFSAAAATGGTTGGEGPRGQRHRPPRRIVGDPFAPSAPEPQPTPSEAAPSSASFSFSRRSQEEHPLGAGGGSMDAAAGREKPIWLGSEGPPPGGTTAGYAGGEQELLPTSGHVRGKLTMEEEMAMYGRGREGGPGKKLTMEEEMAAYSQQHAYQASEPLPPQQRRQQQPQRAQDRQQRAQPQPSPRGARVDELDDQLPTALMSGSGAGSSPPIEQPEEYADQQVKLCPCSICGRKFAADRLPKHEAACAKASQKRAAFNAKDQRMTAEQKQAAHRKGAKGGMGGGGGGGGRGGRGAKGGKWKAESEAFRAMLRQGRRDKELLKQGVKMSELPPPEHHLMEALDDRLECASCGRKFNEQAHARHILHCAGTKNRPTRLVRGGGSGGGRTGFVAKGHHRKGGVF
jgi:hypothetical protein